MTGKVGSTFGIDAIKDSIGQELILVMGGIIYIQLFQLVLTLVEFLVVAHLQGKAGVSLIHLNCEGVSDPLHCQVLSYGLQLLTSGPVVVLLQPPVLDQLQGLLEDVFRTHRGGIRS